MNTRCVIVNNFLKQHNVLHSQIYQYSLNVSKILFYNSSLTEFDSFDSSLTSKRSFIFVACDKELTFMWSRFFRLLFSIVFVFFRRRSRRRSWFWNLSACFNSIFGCCQFVSCSAFIVHTIRGRWSRAFTLTESLITGLWNANFFLNQTAR